MLFKNFTYFFDKNDRIGIIGKNGCGKTTLLKTIVGLEKPDSGTIDIGTTVKIGYFSQENEKLDLTNRVIDEVRDIAEYIRTDDGLITATQMCERFLFDGNMQYTPIEKLSGGERRRLYLLKVLMEAPNVLILDEPTNDLDIQTLQVLEDYLDTFSGIIITVSHDRYFLDRVVSRIFSFEQGGILMQSEGAYTEYTIHKLERDGALDTSSIGKKSDKDNKESKTNNRTKKLSYNEQREYDTIEAVIDELSAKSEELGKEITSSSSDYMKLQKLTEEKEKVDAELDAKIERYLLLQEKVEALNS